jgi:hypothetical protein
MIGIQRVLWGIAMVGTILTYRNHFHTVSAVAYLALALAFTLVSRHVGATTTFDRGTESMRGPAVEPVS